MQLEIVSLCGLFLLISFLVMIQMIVCGAPRVSAASPSFGRQEIVDMATDWKEEVLKNNIIHGSFVQAGDLVKARGDSAVDISKVYYLSNGTTLKAKLWLTSPINEGLLVNVQRLQYGMLIDDDLNSATGIKGADYSTAIEWNNKTNNWYNVFQELGSRSQFETTPAIIKTSSQISNFTSKMIGKRYVDLSVDLNSIGFPDKYKVMFYAVEDRDGHQITDFSNWAYVPTPSFILWTNPDPIEINRGQEKKIMVQLKSFPEVQNLNVDTFYPLQQNNTLPDSPGWDFSELIKSNNLKPMSVTVKVPNKVRIGTYTKDIVAVIDSTSSLPFSTFQRNDSTIQIVENSNATTDGHLVVELPLTVKVSEEIPWHVALNDFLSKYTAIVGIVTFLVGFFIDRKWVWDHLKGLSQSTKKLIKRKLSRRKHNPLTP